MESKEPGMQSIEATPAKGETETIEKIESEPNPSENIIIDKATNRRLLWMISRRILVIQVITYFCQSLDKGVLNYASIMGIKTDAKLVGQEYSWLGTILYIGILVGEYPQNLLLQKLPLAKTLAVNVFIWGREEQSVLNSIWYCMSGVQLMIGGLLAFGVSHFTDGPIKNWQLFFLVLGLFTCAWSFCIGILLPDSPMSAKCFSDADRKLMIERVRHNETGIENKEYKKYQIIETIQDPFVWCCVLLITIANLVIGGLGVFSNLIIQQFGFSILQTQLLNIAQGAWSILVMIGSGWACERFQQTCFIMILYAIPAIIGTIVMLVVTPTSSNAGGMLIAFYCTQFFPAQGNMIISLITRNIAGQTKKGFTMTMVFIGWSVGNLIAPQIFQDSDAPRYLHGFLAHIVVYAVYVCLVIATRFVLMARNRAKTQPGGEISHDLAFQDLTDRENPNFRYVY
ncbi:hypothetical protein FE257_005759 [Aspergillus nanangensis]|uniref:Major facilitator superfamily (MFS) profile domain-containing protein n=1 Tax=Aspergillus nanangensis TaxID=2582783 RepID=A0AAD4CRU1_ASPNN|nr:hypothetical protein FE257_005759 [Aspergillus nanangensis]